MHILSTENLELGCTLIEKAVVDRALRDIEVSISGPVEARREQRARSPGVPFYDASYIQPSSRWPQALPPILRPKPGPLSAQQLKVYKDFTSITVGSAREEQPGGTASLAAGGQPSRPSQRSTARTLASAALVCILRLAPLSSDSPSRSFPCPRLAALRVAGRVPSLRAHHTARSGLLRRALR